MEWNLEDRGTTRAALVPTQAERNGDFSGRRSAAARPAIPIDPLTGAPFAGNRIPANRISAGRPGDAESVPAAERDAGPGQLQQLGDLCHDSRRLEPVAPARTGLNLSAASRIMVRYTQDGWKNGAPSRSANQLGRR